MVKQEYLKLKKKAQEEIQKIPHDKFIQIQVGSASCENAAGAEEIASELTKHIIASGRKDIVIRRVGCTGRCSLEPIVSVFMPSKPLITYKKVTREAVHEIFMSHIMGGKFVEKYLLGSCDLMKTAKTKSQKYLFEHPITQRFYEVYGDVPFYCHQTRIALRNSGLIDPENIYEYIQFEGFHSIAELLEKNDPENVIKLVTESKLRGRGGAGFPTGKKWTFARANEEKTRYMICNADEGDPGAFMDRSILESDPFSVIEGMMIAAFAIGAQRGFFYIRAEYPLAIVRIQKAIDVCRKLKLLGKNILGSNFDFDCEIRLGAGAFVCGEETSLIHSIEGLRGQPRIRPPFPAVSGLWGKPTIINNVETLANLPAIVQLGGKEFANIGTEKSGGTKVFAVSGKVTHTGLVEVPIGTPLRYIVETICGGSPNGKKIKAIQTGGPAGGCIPAHLLDSEVDYETLQQLGTIMGSGGLIVVDQDDCMVQMAKYYLEFSQEESCGKCTPCREGTVRILEILTRITEGQGKLEDLDKLERLCKLMNKASLCGLGRAAPNPVLSVLKYFKEEFIAHIIDKKCPAKQCKSMLHYKIDPKKCVGCTMCARHCPTNCISGERKQAHFIDQSRCIKCGRCFDVCRFDAVKN